MMASISNDPGGRRRILFIAPDGQRKALRLGKVTRRVAAEVKARVEAIVAAQAAGLSIDGETARWLAGIGGQLHARLTAAGLAAPRQASEPCKALTLGAWLDTYIAGRTDVKPSTLRNLKTGRAAMLAFFGADKPLGDITPGDADAWAVWLKGRYAPGTASRVVKWAKQFFRAARRKRLITEDPFADARPISPVDQARRFFVTREVAYKILEACPDAEWRLAFALCRFGGLRCPSELRALRWADVDWERGRFLVHAPKTEHHEGKAKRWVPIFPELRQYLEEAFEVAEPGAVHVIPRLRDTQAGLWGSLARIIRRAGLTPWPKLFQNLRSTRETELAAEFPIHVVCAWIGNSQRIAAKHYLQVTEGDFARAAQNPAQQAAAAGCMGSQGQEVSSPEGPFCGHLRPGASPGGLVARSVQEALADVGSGHTARLGLAEPAVAVGGEHVVGRVAQERRDGQQDRQRRPGPAEVAHGSQRGRRPGVRPTVLDQDGGVEVVGAQPEPPQQRLAGFGLQGGEADALVRVVVDQEVHAGVAELAHAVEQQNGSGHAPPPGAARLVLGWVVRARSVSDGSARR
jgi:integrase